MLSENSSRALVSTWGKLRIGSFDDLGAGLTVEEPCLGPLSASVERSHPSNAKTNETHSAIQRMEKPILAEIQGDAAVLRLAVGDELRPNH
ncbi:MAG: hypothetical protein EP303_00690 [Deltaproteobacteria bacterium]|nr:MAG: hypothetical protein EP303_00690 [Deltaproteobacteria bacterium]